MDKPPQNRNAKTPLLNPPLRIQAPGGGLYLEFALEYKVKLNKEKMVNFLNTTS